MKLQAWQMTYPLSQTLDYQATECGLKIQGHLQKLVAQKPSYHSTPNQEALLEVRTLYLDKDNSPIACSFHGHTTGRRGCFLCLLLTRGLTESGATALV
ncbi:hypothetical protein NC653_004808 [Populus alba x Populus x berolinensis]|uniref:Uncharacterized protein n=1 Tax=Populus alba x Populus x berolinensis TaxID=444605 RepID=A0AAD6RUY0_9ROSI|nr:hypothetical protein NC653_004808 [Populus alba x Populus x berolinensis]